MRATRHDEMPFDVEGWLSSPRVRRMNTSERGMFFQLLCEGWADKSCSLPNDEVELQFLAAATDSEWAAGSKKVLAMFELEDGRLANAKQLEMLAAQNGRLAAARRNRDKVRKYREGLASNNGHDEEVEESTETPPKPVGPAIPAFDLFWKLYPLKKGKEDAKKAFERALKKTTVEAILAAVADQIGWEDWTKEDGKFIPHPATWLNAGRWSDEKKPGADPRFVPGTTIPYFDNGGTQAEDDRKFDQMRKELGP